jgi:hypothetical protein
MGDISVSVPLALDALPTGASRWIDLDHFGRSKIVPHS